MNRNLIKITKHNETETVNARELHQFLHSRYRFSDWIKSRIEKYQFVESEDYLKVSEKIDTLGGAQKGISYYLTIDMAKELSMVENNGFGRRVRKFFITRESELRKIEENRHLPKTLPEALRAYAFSLENLEQAENRTKRLIHSKRTYTTTEIAKELGYKSATAFNKILHEKEVIYKSSKKTWLLYAKHSDKNYAEIRQKEVFNQEIDKPFIVYTLQWTGKGREWLLEMFNQPFELESL